MMTDYVKKYDICQVLNRLEVRLGDELMKSRYHRLGDILSMPGRKTCDFSHGM